MINPNIIYLTLRYYFNHCRRKKSFDNLHTDYNNSIEASMCLTVSINFFV